MKYQIFLKNSPTMLLLEVLHNFFTLKKYPVIKKALAEHSFICQNWIAKMVLLEVNFYFTFKCLLLLKPKLVSKTKCIINGHVPRYFSLQIKASIFLKFFNEMLLKWSGMHVFCIVCVTTYHVSFFREFDCVIETHKNYFNLSTRTAITRDLQIGPMCVLFS